MFLCCLLSGTCHSVFISLELLQKFSLSLLFKSLEVVDGGSFWLRTCINDLTRDMPFLSLSDENFDASSDKSFCWLVS